MKHFIIILVAALAWSHTLLSAHVLSEFGIDQLLIIRSGKEEYKPVNGINRRFPYTFSAYDELKQTGYTNEIAVYDLNTDTFTTIFTPPLGRMVADIDLHWLGHKLVFTMSDGNNFHIYEIILNGLENRTGTARRITPDTYQYVHHYDPTYAPDGSIIFCSTASYHTVPCWHGKWHGANLFRIESDGTDMRMLTNDQALVYTPITLPSGQIMYSRWNYIGTAHQYYRTIMLMNPDGTGQRSIAGINSWWPPAIMHTRAVPGNEHLIVGIGLGHHGARRIGRLLRYDVSKGSREAMGVIELPSGDKPTAEIADALVAENMKDAFIHPWPIDKNHTIVSRRILDGSTFRLYLVDAGTNSMSRIKVDPMDLFEPIPYTARPRPHQRPNRTKDKDGNWLPSSTPATVYIDDIHVGPGLADVPVGSVKSLRVGSYNFGYKGLGGPHSLGPSGPWETMRILGTVPVEEDGSVYFEAPSMIPLFLQPLDEHGRSMQVFRGWFTARPGEAVSCIGCHESPNVTPATGRQAIASLKQPDQIEEWYGPARGIDFERDVQPVLDRYCVGCHQPGQTASSLDLRRESLRPEYDGREFVEMDADRITVDDGRIKYTPAFEALLNFIYRSGYEDTVDMHTPGEFHILNSHLMQMLYKGHYGVAMDTEAWDRLTTWIDMNTPAHGNWKDVWGKYPDNGQAHNRRMELFDLYGGPVVDSEYTPFLNPDRTPVFPISVPDQGSKPTTEGWPFSNLQAEDMQGEGYEDFIDLGNGVMLDLVHIPGGSFIMGASHAYGSGNNGAWQAELPATETSVDSFWIGEVEITNAQFRQFESEHHSGYFNERYQDRKTSGKGAASDGPGLGLDGDDQPAVRISWDMALTFCNWLSNRTGRNVRLPTEAEWEWACRAGTESSHWYGNGGDFSLKANVADERLATITPTRNTGGVEHFLAKFPTGGIHCDDTYNDGYRESAPVGSFETNQWRLYDMHGNVAEWTASAYRNFPYNPSDGRNNTEGGAGLRVVRGGSYRDHPDHCGSAYRVALPSWVRTGTVGFRIVVE